MRHWICRCGGHLIHDGWGFASDLNITPSYRHVCTQCGIPEFSTSIWPKTELKMIQCSRVNRLTFAALKAANAARLPLFRDAKGRMCHGPDQKPWALSQWSNAVCGELGEAANLIKKIERGDFELEEVKESLAKELADVVCYLDLLAQAAGIDLGSAVTAKFNEVSVRVGAPIRLTAEGTAETGLD